MTQLSDDCFAFGGDLMRTEEALGLLEDRLVPVVDNEDVPLRAAAGRVLAADFCAARAVPPHDNAAVDGYAVFFDDLAKEGDTRLPVTGRIAAGHPLERDARQGEALRIFTGAPMPDGPDTVLMQEDCTTEAEHVIIPPGIRRGANRRHAGEDIEKGGIILRAGQRLRPQDIGLAASVGCAALTVYRRLRVAVFSTGDEVREVGEDLPPGCIYDSNRYAVSALLESLGHELVEDAPVIDWPSYFDALVVIWSANLAWSIDLMGKIMNRRPGSDNLQHVTEAIWRHGQGISATDFIAAQAVFNTANRAASAMFEKYDLVLSPTLAKPPIKLGTLDQNAEGVDTKEWTKRVFEWCAFRPRNFSARAAGNRSKASYWLQK